MSIGPKIFSMLSSRHACWLLLLYQAIFFNIVIPGHTRGAITLDGKHHPDSMSCCCCCRGSGTESRAGHSTQSPSQKDREQCAICNFAARVMPTPIVQFQLPELGLADILPVLAPEVPDAFHSISTRQSRAPPRAA